MFLQEVEDLIQGLNFIPTFVFRQDVSYEEFMNRIYANNELTLRPLGLWEQVPHPWLDLFVPKSRISDFDEGVFKGILIKQNISAATGILLVYPADKSK